MGGDLARKTYGEGLGLSTSLCTLQGPMVLGVVSDVGYIGYPRSVGGRESIFCLAAEPAPCTGKAALVATRGIFVESVGC